MVEKMREILKKKGGYFFRINKLIDKYKNGINI